MKIWSNTNVSAICSVHGISKKRQENILERQSNIVSLEHYSLKDVKNEHPKDSDIIIKYSTENEDLFCEWNGGSTTLIYRLSDAFTISCYCEIIFKFDYRMDKRNQNTVIL